MISEKESLTGGVSFESIGAEVVRDRVTREGASAILRQGRAKRGASMVRMERGVGEWSSGGCQKESRECKKRKKRNFWSICQQYQGTSHSNGKEPLATRARSASQQKKAPFERPMSFWIGWFATNLISLIPFRSDDEHSRAWRSIRRRGR